MKFLKDFGALVALAGMAAAGLIGWGQMQTKIEAHGADLAALKPQVQQVQTDNAVLKEAVEDIRQTVHQIWSTHK